MLLHRSSTLVLNFYYDQRYSDLFWSIDVIIMWILVTVKNNFNESIFEGIPEVPSRFGLFRSDRRK